MKQHHKRFWVEHLTPHQYALMPNNWYKDIIGIINYGNTKINFTPSILISTPVLNENDIYEVWHDNSPLQQGQYANISYRCSEKLLFGGVTIINESLKIATKTAYREILALQDTLNYTAILRIWNYFPAINKETDGIERYRQFNIGRQDALLDCGRSLTENLPAASVLGTTSGNLSIAFIAARTEVINIENPRQVSSYNYPPQYGLRPPAFSRASLINLYDNYILFISGTASIVGYNTLHIGDVVKQTIESMNNISAVIAEAKRHIATVVNIQLTNLLYKVYIRHAADIQLVKSTLQNYVGDSLQAIYLQADICRADLLVEIEAYVDNF